MTTFAWRPLLSDLLLPLFLSTPQVTMGSKRPLRRRVLRHCRALSLHAFRTPPLLNIPSIGDERARNPELEVLSTEPEPWSGDAEEILVAAGLHVRETYQTRNSAENLESAIRRKSGT